MNTYSADLHLHTDFSDGTFTPPQLVRKANKLGFNAISITDHDIVDGIAIANKVADEVGITLIPGVELTVEWGTSELHILGYYINCEVGWFKDLLREICEARVERMKKMVYKLNDLGIELTFQDVLKKNKKGAVGRLHLANVLYEKGKVNSTKEAFYKYIGDNGPCYVKKYKLSPKEAIEDILRVDGIPVLAHPGMSVSESDIYSLIDMGLEGIEVYHPGHSQIQITQYKKLAQENNLIITGGSDCHGKAKEKVLLGKIRVNEEIVESLNSKRKLVNR